MIMKNHASPSGGREGEKKRGFLEPLERLACLLRGVYQGLVFSVARSFSRFLCHASMSSENKSNSAIERDILKPSKERIKESGSDVWFDYELICKYPTKGRKPKADTIVFKIHTLHPREEKGEQYRQYDFVYRWVVNAMDNPTSNKAVNAVDKITEAGRLKMVYERCCYYDDKVCSGEMTKQHAYNSLLKMLRDEFKIK